MLFRNPKGQVCGELKEGVYRKKVSKRKHLLKAFNAWGIDSAIIDELPPETEIRLLDVDEDTIYSISLEDFREMSVERDYGFGKQMFVSRPNWKQDAHALV